MSSEWVEIELLDTEEGCPRPPAIVFPPSYDRAQFVKPAVAAFRKTLEGSKIYPPDLIIDEELGMRVDEALYTHYKYYYLHLADLMEITVPLDDMEPVSRHEFFICTEPIQDWRNPEQMLAGISKLEGLLGYSYPKSNVSEKPPFIPSGDYESYVGAAVCLTFKNAAPYLLQRYDMIFLSSMLKDAGYLSDPDKKEGGSYQQASAPPPPAVKDASFENKKEEISDKLKASGIRLPERF